ncbi:MAG TPA: hypothetical protein P5232_02370 [Candidatus Moranbacteria bacterium]|nr:hypothetical protein [Candidatus Moranbacteria bacterium]
MLYDPQKKQNFEDEKLKTRQEKAQKTLKENSIGKNKGQAQKTIRSAKNLLKKLTPLHALSLATQIRPSDLVYLIALVAAILKDFLIDPIEATGIGYAFVFIITLLVSILIWFMMTLANFSDSGQKVNHKVIKSWLVLLGGTTAEMLFGVNILPIETLTVFIIYFMALSARKEAKEKAKEEAAAQESYA